MVKKVQFQAGGQRREERVRGEEGRDGGGGDHKFPQVHSRFLLTGNYKLKQW